MAIENLLDNAFKSGGQELKDTLDFIQHLGNHKIINQRFGQNWAYYNADCVLGMRNLPSKSVHFIPYSPPFLALYIYSDSIGDLGNTDSEEQFFEGYRFHLQEMHRVLADDGKMAIHCKDTMRYMTSHGYAGLFDFPGHIIRLCQEVGFNFERWITIWKDPVIEMQRTKTYGLLHKSFEERGEVTRQGCADYALVFSKSKEVEISDHLPKYNPEVIERCIHQWTNPGETIQVPQGVELRGRDNQLFPIEPVAYSFWSQPSYSVEFPYQLNIQPGRLVTIHSTPKMQQDIVKKFEDTNIFKFHSRCHLTDNSFLVTFRNWTGDFQNNVVKHTLQAPEVDYQKFELVVQQVKEDEIILENREIWRQAVTTGREIHPDYVGLDKPLGWHDRKYYSILVWQRYASPVWFDLPGLPDSNENCWMNIVQTNVLNYRQSKSDQEEKHICPLQLDLIEKLILEYTEPDDVVLTPYGGISSECYEAIKVGRKAIGFELKPEYWEIGVRNLEKAEMEITQERMI